MKQSINQFKSHNLKFKDKELTKDLYGLLNKTTWSLHNPESWISVVWTYLR